MDGRVAAKVRRFEEQILPHLPDIYRAARRLVRTVADAEDLVQETCLRAFRSLDQLERPEAAKAWTFTVLRSAFLREAARWDAARHVTLDAVESSSRLGHRLLGASDGSLWEGALIGEARLATLRLPIAFREVVVLAHIGGFSYREMAAILGIPIGTVMSRLFRARGLLRGALRESGAPQDRPHAR